jgi:hypothetical protein
MTPSISPQVAPYEGREVVGWPQTVLSRGKVIVADGKLAAKPGQGRFLPRTAGDAAKGTGRMAPRVRSRAQLRGKAHVEHDPEKWVAVFGKRSCSINKLKRDDDSKKSHRASEGGTRRLFFRRAILRQADIAVGSRRAVGIRAQHQSRAITAQ